MKVALISTVFNEGDVIRTIQDNHDYLGHYHTAGVPGRHEIDETQELNYAPIMRAIVETGFQGHVAQEFIPAKPDALASLKQAGLDVTMLTGDSRITAEAGLFHLGERR